MDKYQTDKDKHKSLQYYCFIYHHLFYCCNIVSLYTDYADYDISVESTLKS